MGDKLKSAVELAMEKSGVKKDAAEKLSAEQKERIEEIKKFYKAKKAELEILYQQDLKKMPAPQRGKPDPGREQRKGQYARDVERLESEEKRKIADVRQGN